MGIDANLWFYTHLTQGILRALTTSVHVPPDADLWHDVVAFASLHQTADAVGETQGSD